MSLVGVRTKEELEKIYKSMKLTETKDKIKFLSEEMDIVAMMGHGGGEKEDLIGLEETLLLQAWPAL